MEVTLGDGKFIRIETLNFLIVRSKSPYNLLIGRTAMQKMGIVVSTVHEAVKFQTAYGVGTIFSSYNEGEMQGVKKKAKEGPQEFPRDTSNHMETEEQMVINESHPEQKVTLGSSFLPPSRED